MIKKLIIFLILFLPSVVHSDVGDKITIEDCGCKIVTSESSFSTNALDTTYGNDPKTCDNIGLNITTCTFIYECELDHVDSNNYFFNVNVKNLSSSTNCPPDCTDEENQANDECGSNNWKWTDEENCEYECYNCEEFYENCQIKCGVEGVSIYYCDPETGGSTGICMCELPIEDTDEGIDPRDPDSPDAPENPDNPDIPDTPDNPDIPDTPDTPDSNDPDNQPEDDPNNDPENTPDEDNTGWLRGIKKNTDTLVDQNNMQIGQNNIQIDQNSTQLEQNSIQIDQNNTQIGQLSDIVTNTSTIANNQGILQNELSRTNNSIKSLKIANEKGFGNLVTAINDKESPSVDFSELSTDGSAPEIPEFDSSLPTDKNYNEYDDGTTLATDAAGAYASENLTVDPQKCPINAEITASGDPCLNGNVRLHGNTIPVSICFNKLWMLQGYAVMRILFIGLGYLQTAILLNKAITA